MRAGLALLTTAFLVGCGGPTGPASTDVSSDSLPSLERRVEFLERYVTFRRGYRDLGFHITYKNNNGGLVPGPSDWDIRLVATVPPDELAAWVPVGVAKTERADVSWIVGVPNAERAAGITEWYVVGRKVFGVDRERSVVAYRYLRY
jgi:hypothetical protein